MNTLCTVTLIRKASTTTVFFSLAAMFGTIFSVAGTVAAVLAFPMCLAISIRPRRSMAMSPLVEAISTMSSRSSLSPSSLLFFHFLRLSHFLFLMQAVDPNVLHNTLKNQTASAHTTHLRSARKLTGSDILDTRCNFLSIFVWWSRWIRS